MRFILTFGLLAALNGALNAQNYYTVKFPDDKTIFGCGITPDTIWPEINQYYVYGCNINVGVSVKDQVFYTNDEQTCFKIFRTFKLIYWCDYNPNSYQPVLIENPTSTDVGATATGTHYNHGFLQYTQIIKVLDNVPPVFLDCPDETVVFCDYTDNDPNQYHVNHVDRCEGPVDLHVAVTDACSKSDIKMSYRLFLDMDQNGSMETYISSSDANAWPIGTTVVNDTLFARVNFPNGFGLPYGTHKIEWIANDNCAGQSECKYAFEVKDCKAPTVVCINGLSINIMQTGMITLWDTDFLQYTYDNCTPEAQLKIGIQKSPGTGSFPYDSHSVTFTCSELGVQPVQIWSIDAYGNADYCETFVIVQDNSGSCPPSSVIYGNLLTSQLKPVPGATVSASKNSNLIQQVQSDSTGVYALDPMQAGCNYLIAPLLDNAASEGVNTFDALLTAAHLQQMLPLPTPYDLIAADADQSGTITAADIEEMVQLIIGNQTAFSNNTSWRFIPESYVFPDPANPFANSVPEALGVCLSGAPNFDPDFVAVKTGDVDGTALGSDADDRSGDEPVWFTAANTAYQEGDEVRIDIMTPADMGGLAGFQFTLQYDLPFLSLQSIEPGLAPLQWIHSDTEQGIVAVSWHSALMLGNTENKNLRVPVMTLVFKALQEGAVRRNLEMTSSMARAEAYNTQLQGFNAALKFETPQGRPSASAQFMPLRPNPVTTRTTAAFYLPEAGEVSFTVSDALGKRQSISSRYFDAGYHEHEVELPATLTPGLFFLRIDTGSGSDVQSFMKQ